MKYKVVFLFFFLLYPFFIYSQSTLKPKGVIYNKWILNLDKLRLVSEDKQSSLEIIWNVDEHIKKYPEAELYSKHTVKSMDGKVMELNIRYRKSEQTISGYIITATQNGTQTKIWEYNPAFPFTVAEKMRVISFGNKLIILVYSRISSGCDLVCLDWNTGKEIWHADLKQVNADHSQYLNDVYLKIEKNKIIIAGNEAYGKYLQVIDALTGKNLFSTLK